MLHFTEVLTLLDNNRYCSGEALAKRFNVTRATIHNCIVKIESLGISVERVRGLGYRLTQPVDLLNQAEIQSILSESVANKLANIQCLEEIDSTNRYATGLALPQAGEFSLVLAEMQTAGRGRRGRQWVSPYAANVYLSIVWPLQRPLHESGMLSAMLAISMLTALEELGVSGLNLKWPNDIYSHNKKLAGLLIECAGEISGGCKMIIGMGVNVFMSQFKKVDIDQQWTDMFSHTQDWQYSRNHIAAMLINKAVVALSQFEDNAFDDLAGAWSQWDIMKDKAVELHSAQSIQTGVARGIDNDGCLLLETPNGIEKISAGDVSLRMSA
ncbi:MAG: biotin--[acetyl-CoA-carboxylase] ligase [Gammaproteobacteria bacterium]